MITCQRLLGSNMQRARLGGDIFHKDLPPFARFLSVMFRYLKNIDFCWHCRFKFIQLQFFKLFSDSCVWIHPKPQLCHTQQSRKRLQACLRQSTGFTLQPLYAASLLFPQMMPASATMWWEKGWSSCSRHYRSCPSNWLYHQAVTAWTASRSKHVLHWLSKESWKWKITNRRFERPSLSATRTRHSLRETSCQSPCSRIWSDLCLYWFSKQTYTRMDSCLLSRRTTW